MADELTCPECSAVLVDRAHAKKHASSHWPDRIPDRRDTMNARIRQSFLTGNELPKDLRTEPEAVRLFGQPKGGA